MLRAISGVGEGGVDRRQHGAGRAERRLQLDRPPVVPGTGTRSPKQSRLARKAAGSAPWKLKIDCLTSPTAKIVRRSPRAPSPGEELLGQAS